MLENVNNYEYHIKIISNRFSYNNFEDDFVKLILYISFNNIEMNKEILPVMLSCEKCKIFHSIIRKLLLVPEINEKFKITETCDKNTLQKIFNEYLNYHEFTSLKNLINK